ncbi:MAG: hypothetical protein M5U34_38315 [Chloroflexi bacterium]|nr:hypothetical protein [Chloroflexota bacterium]
MSQPISVTASVADIPLWWGKTAVLNWVCWARARFWQRRTGTHHPTGRRAVMGTTVALR